MAATRDLLLLLVLAALSGPSTSVTTETIDAAAQTLANTDRLSMSLTIQMLNINSSALAEAPSLTIFAPSDAAFSRSGQPLFSRALYQCSPIPYPLPSLHSLPVGSKIPTLLPNHTLVITSNANSVNQGTPPSLNGLKIDQVPIFDSGSLLILGVDEFFDMGFEASAPGKGSNVCGSNVSSSGNYSFGGVNKALRSNGYGIMASFLDLQLPVTFQEGTALTIFAPADWAARDHEIKDYPSFISRHIVPCKYQWHELVNLEDGFILETLLGGYEIKLRKASGGQVLLINGVHVSHPNLYANEWLVVHGLDGLFVEPRTPNGAVVTGFRHSSLIGAGNFQAYVISSLFLHLFRNFVGLD